MRAKITYLVTAAVLVFYFVLVGSRGVMLIQSGTPVTVAFGIAVLILPVIGLWFLWKNTQFVRRANQLAAELDAEGGLPVDELAQYLVDHDLDHTLITTLDGRLVGTVSREDLGI